MTTGERARLSGRRLSNLHLRQRVLRAIRSFYDAREFLEVETPAMVPSPGLDVHLAAFEVRGSQGSRFLHTSPEYQMKRLLAAGLPRIYQLGKAFRDEERGHLHQPEFTLLEWYRAHAGSAEVMADTEQLVAEVVQTVLGSSQLPCLQAAVDVTPPWPRLTVAQAFRQHGGVEVDSLLPDEDAFFRTLVEKVEPALGRGRPTFLTEYPASMASLARLLPGKPSVADRFELYVDGIELCNGFGELTDPAEQRRRFRADASARDALQLPSYPIDERFLAAMDEGLPPSGGNALGVDRLLMLMCSASHIEEVVAFSTDEL